MFANATRGITTALFALSLLGTGCDQGAKNAVEAKPGDKAKAAEGDKEAKEGEKEGTPATEAKLAPADGSIAVEGKDDEGNVVVKAALGPDGKAIVEAGDSKIEVNSDGTVVKTNDADVKVDKDGGVQVDSKGANAGDSVKTKNGDVEVKAKDGDDVKVNKDGDTVVKTKDGKEIKVGKDGKVDLKGVPGM